MKLTLYILLLALLTLACLPCAAAAGTKFAPDDTDEPLVEPGFTPVYRYRVYLADKKQSPYSLRRPEEFLSEQSIRRRKRQGLRLDETDLPISPAYLQKLAALGLGLGNRSKWNNTVVVETTDTAVLAQVRALPFVKDVLQVAVYRHRRIHDNVDRYSLIEDANGPKKTMDDMIAMGWAKQLHIADQDSAAPAPIDSIEIAREMLRRLVPTIRNNDQVGVDDTAPDHIYGSAFDQINQLNALYLHENGYMGEGMTITIIDGGFLNADIVPMLRGTKILGTKDFVEPGASVFETNKHGTEVLSTMATYVPDRYIGTAPHASFWLLRSEDDNSEQPIEEDNWVAAVEFADSVGTDLINTSLGYCNFDDKSLDVKYHELDGHSRISSNTASMLASKGIILCVSAGNTAHRQWHLITVPADAEDVLTVGAVTSKGENAVFSSLGNTADGRIKPDVMARGQQAFTVSVNGKIGKQNGSSFASPILCGAVACFWQAHPNMTAKQVIDYVRSTGNNTQHPNNVYGYGIPDFNK